MKVAYHKSFGRDLKQIKDQAVHDQVRQAIEQVKAADTLQEINALKKLSGTDNCYRIRIGNYRIGVKIEDDTVEFVRCLPRRDMYRFFP